MQNNEIKEMTKVLKSLGNKQASELYYYITNLQEQLHQASLDIQELTERDIECPSWCNKLTNLQQENNNLKTSLDESQEVVIELQQENERLKWDKEQLNSLVNSCQDEIRKLKELCDGYEEEHSNEFQCWKRDRKELLDKRARIEKAVEYIKSHQKVFALGVNEEVDEFDYISTSPKALLNILNGDNNE